jgi:hypothetical protein
VVKISDFLWSKYWSFPKFGNSDEIKKQNFLQLLRMLHPNHEPGDSVSSPESPGETLRVGNTCWMISTIKSENLFLNVGISFFIEVRDQKSSEGLSIMEKHWKIKEKSQFIENSFNKKWIPNNKMFQFKLN